MELRDYLRVVRRRWGVIAVAALLGLGVAALLTYTATPKYASSVKLYVSTAQSSTSAALESGLLSQQRIFSYTDFATSRELAAQVVNELDLEVTPGELIGKVSAVVVPDTVVLELTVTDPDPAQARALAQAYAEGLSDMVREFETPPGKEVAPPIKMSIVDAASQPGAPVSPRPTRNMAVGLLLGLAFGVGGALVRENLDTSVKSLEDVTGFTAAPLLGAIAYDTTARQAPLVSNLGSHTPRVESFRVLRTNLQFVDVDTTDKVFVVTSAVPSEGKTSTSVNLAITLAQAGVRTLLIECDLRRPHAAASLEMDNAVGVTTVLLGRVSVSDAIQKHEQSDLHFLGSGAIPPNPAELLQSRAMADLLSQVRSEYDMVIVDAPPLLPVTDASLLAAQSDGALVVVCHGKTSKDELANAIGRVEQVGGKVVGIVLNMVPTSRRYGGAYGYGYGYAPLVESTTPSRGRRKELRSTQKERATTSSRRRLPE
ncbi:polysaccharide biosynthesis tyrosine autokinase [Nocardioides sp. cx-173]|uniref:polysaccharide biosynthesis tyrosine autokinase n=1 Tax=Nocardioides sp. cx-173 TaxID=2898796 RepID=UPI001E29B83B|nr:polysaccharide biosynthesis tyrosine autokinase [Nocardioides sp. cx-173]MCD4526929.1 polysaccharide biosynthesis tyrosine autokinase [Nocardioides sp. cx-173]